MEGDKNEKLTTLNLKKKAVQWPSGSILLFNEGCEKVEKKGRGKTRPQVSDHAGISLTFLIAEGTVVVAIRTRLMHFPRAVKDAVIPGTPFWMNTKIGRGNENFSLSSRNDCKTKKKNMTQWVIFLGFWLQIIWCHLIFRLIGIQSTSAAKLLINSGDDEAALAIVLRDRS